MTDKNIHEAAREHAHLHGCIVAYDTKDAMDMESFGHWCDESYDLIYDDDMFNYVCGFLYEDYASSEDEGDEPLYRTYRETLSPEELDSNFSEYMLNFNFFRLNKNIPVDDMEMINKILQEQCYFAPVWVWVKGQLVSEL
ncbi:TPA: hypothetical protein M1G86_003827 [Salmonella enterica subsp. enterica serovar Wien]|nr:hypothetical protein [Salmonella enterica subsp. enterica serovar Waycross]EHA7902981.1 hypothetical protein [Salmonella enterica]HCB5750876.1 hypothetical protein [Salmonella enterica subsp. enterica serovar Wien]EDA7704016.1 hypothetical protein [Salmonella enterica subsp. enterica serovar Waycross]HCB5704123.1 hypothetical protein [Salmonella enterica subsp. enterica serovar Waycross]